MPAPALRIPMVLDDAEFKRRVEDTTNRVGTAARVITQQFANMNREIVQGATVAAGAFAGSWSSAFATTAVSVLTRFGLIIGAAKLIGDVVAKTREQLREMVEVAERAQAVQLSPEFFQAFLAAGQGARDTVRDLQDALENASRATAPRLNTEISALEPERIKQGWNEVEIAIDRALMVLQSAPQGAAGPLAFLGAENQDQRVQAALVTMRDLLAAGQQLEALNLGEKMFGAQFVANVRTGKQSIDDLLQTINDTLARSAGAAPMFSNENVRNAKELDDRLKDAWQTIDNNLKPSWEALATLALSIKSLWVSIVELIARASNLLPSFNFPKNAQGVPLGAGVGGETDAMLQGTGIAQPTAQPTRLTVRPEPLPSASLPSISGEDILRRLGGRLLTIPAKTETGVERNDFERQVESIERHIAMIEADTAAIGRNEAAQAKLRAELGLLQAIVREGGDVTSEQVDQYARLRATMEPQQALTAAGIRLNAEYAESFDRVTNRMGEAALRSMQLRDQWRGLQDAVQFAGHQLVDIFDQLGSKTRSFGDIVQSTFQMVKRAFLEAALVGSGPLAGILGTRSSVAGDAGGIIGALLSVFGGARASGGPVEPGKAYLINEQTPNSELFIPNTAGTVVPNAVMRSLGGGRQLVVQLTSAPVFQAGMTATDIAAIEARLHENNQVLRQTVQNDLKTAIRNDRDFLEN